MISDYHRSDAKWGALVKSFQFDNPIFKGTIDIPFIYLNWNIAMNSCTHQITAEELALILSAPSLTRDDWVSQLCAARDVGMLTDDEILEIAAEYDPAGPTFAIDSLMCALAARLQDDRVALAALTAIRHYHLGASDSALRN